MDDVIRDARDPPRKRHLPSADEKIRNGAQRAEAQPVQPRDGRPECAALASAKRQRSEHDDRPDVEIHQVPKPRAVERDLEQGKAERRIERLRPVHRRGQKQQQRDGMHVRDKAQALLAATISAQKNDSSAISRMLSLADLPADIQHKVVHIAVRDGLAVHAELGKRAVHAVAHHCCSLSSAVSPSTVST